nr:MAG TPA: lipocalin domain-like protein [Caudoviricetes sp.]
MKITNNFASTIIGTVSGRITYNGRTINITCDCIKGHCSTMSGDIRR